MKVMVIGSGGREHSIIKKLSESPLVSHIYAVPGNAGTRRIAQNVDIPPSNPSALAHFASGSGTDLVVVGPEISLAAGVVDTLESCGIKVFGPCRRAAEIETSKAFAKRLMKSVGVPTATFGTFREFKPAFDYACALGAPLVIKASGLASGKGVRICRTIDRARIVLEGMLVQGKYGPAADEVVVEEFLDGEEISVHALCDGENYKIFPLAQDHKYAYDGNIGPMTGGMGAVAPITWLARSRINEVRVFTISPILNRLEREGRRFKGLLYPGLKMTGSGPKVLEYNARFGDPEAQVFMRLLKSDIAEVFLACVEGRLKDIALEWHEGFAVCIVLVSEGYPKREPTEYPNCQITGIEEAEKYNGIEVYHAGTKLDADGETLLAAGGRVLNVTARGTTLKDALDRAYEAVNCIKFKGMRYRFDIGAKALLYVR